MSVWESVAESDVADEPRIGGASAPYMSFRSLENYFERFSEDGLPAVFDKSYFNNASGSLVAQVRGSFRSLGLIDSENRPTDLLVRVVQSQGDGRRALLREVFEATYADALSLDRNATSGQLAEVFRARGLSGATLVKAMAFFMTFAQYLEYELSPHFRKGRTRAAASGTSTSRRRRSPATRRSIDTDVDAMSPTQSPVDQRAQYVAMLMSLAKESDGEVQATLLDRIERALAIEGA